MHLTSLASRRRPSTSHHRPGRCPRRSGRRALSFDRVACTWPGRFVSLSVRGLRDETRWGVWGVEKRHDGRATGQQDSRRQANGRRLPFILARSSRGVWCCAPLPAMGRTMSLRILSTSARLPRSISPEQQKAHLRSRRRMPQMRPVQEQLVELRWRMSGTRARNRRHGKVPTDDRRPPRAVR